MKNQKEMNKLNPKRSVKKNRVIITAVCLVFGFMISFSYHITNSQENKSNITSSQFERDMALREELIKQEEINRSLQKELAEKQQQVLEIEKQLSNEAQTFHRLADDAEKYRMYLGKVKVKGKGVQVTLADAAYSPSGENVNSYIVHEHHVFKVINELYISGASAVSINGQRLTRNSYILCNGPVIEVDGYQHPAPFVISAIGDPNTMIEALNIKDGVKDLLVNENVQFTLEKKDQIVMDAIYGS